LRDSSSEEDFEGRHRLGALFSGYVEEIGTYLCVTRARKILRRYFAMNAIII